MGGGERRFPAGAQAPSSVGYSLFLLLMAVALAAAAVQQRGYSRAVWAWPDVVDVELQRVTGSRFPYRRLRVVGRSTELVSDSVTCSVRRRHPERSRAGRAVADVRALLGCGGPW